MRTQTHTEGRAREVTGRGRVHTPRRDRPCPQLVPHVQPPDGDKSVSVV